MSETDDGHLKRLSIIRDEMRFELGIFHDRVNAFISAEAFLLISFTMSLAYAGAGPTARFHWIAPALSAVGFALAVLAWPGLNTGYRIIVEWNVLFMDALNEAHASSTLRWRPSVFVDGDRRIHAAHRRGMLFSRYVPIVFMTAWVVLVGIVLASLPR